APRHPPPPSTAPAQPSSWTIALDDVRLRDGAIELHEQNAPALIANTLAIDGEARVGPDALDTALALTGQLMQPEAAPISLRIATRGTGLTPSGEVTLDELRFSAGTSTLEAHGALARGQANLELEAHVARTLAAALGVPLGSDLVVKDHVTWKKGQPVDVAVTLPLGKGGASLDAQLWP